MELSVGQRRCINVRWTGRKAGAGLLAVVALAGFATFLLVRHPSLGPSIQAVSSERLSAAGIVLLNPFPWDPPRLTRSDAEQIAMKQGPGGPVLQSVLAEFVNTNAGS
jgi:hypothetical protein